MSARQLSQAAEAPVSSIYHHFGSLEHLFLAGQQTCLIAARHWGEQQITHARGVAGSPESFAGFFAHALDDWAQQQRPLAFAWRECLLLADRNPMFRETAEQWTALWRRFWREAAEVFALRNNLIIAERIFETESLYHLVRWQRLIDRAALDETARGVAAWLAGAPAPAAPWRAFAHAEAFRTIPVRPERDAVTSGIMAAAADLIARGGVAGVTHRAVAEQAGVTLGTVSHKFPTKSGLLEAAFEGIYAAMTSQAEASSDSDRQATSPHEVVEDIARAVVHTTQGAGRDELVLAAARDPALATFGAQVRYLRGRSSRAGLQALIGPDREASLLEAALFSAFLSSQLRAYAGRPAPTAWREAASELAGLATMLAP
jgi:AcrR family transcriptional regulator